MASLDHYAIEELLSDKERTARDLGRRGLCRKRWYPASRPQISRIPYPADECISFYAPQ